MFRLFRIVTGGGGRTPSAARCGHLPLPAHCPLPTASPLYLTFGNWRATLSIFAATSYNHSSCLMRGVSCGSLRGNSWCPLVAVCELLRELYLRCPDCRGQEQGAGIWWDLALTEPWLIMDAIEPANGR